MYDDSITHAHCAEVKTIAVDLSDIEIDDWKENEFQHVEADAKESTEEPQEIEIGKCFNSRSRFLNNIVFDLNL